MKLKVVRKNKMQNLEQILKQHKLTTEDYQNILKILKRKPNLEENGIFSAMRRDHCRYKYRKIYLKRLHNRATLFMTETEN